MSPTLLPPEFEQWLHALLLARGVDLDEPRALAAQVQQLSDFYITQTRRPTPWQESFAANAYLSYFLPLNTARLKAVWRQVTRFLPPDAWQEIWDIGAGLSPTHWVLESDRTLEARPFFGVEISKAAQALHAECAQAAGSRWQLQFRETVRPQSRRALGVFSYSFLEMQNQLPDLKAFEHLLIVEPSMRECGRSLMQWRSQLQGMGFQALAPCLHQEACPLLTQSQKDWCHTRIHFEAPDWWRRLEEFLPMQNRTLTYSYLLMSRTVQPHTEFEARVVGDTLHENGKSRQMICRGPQREFISWLHRHGPPPEIPHGALLSGLKHAEVKGHELRIPPGTLQFTD